MKRINDEELSCVRKPNQSLLAQIKKLKVEKKTQPKLDPHVNKKYPVNKETMTDPIEVGISSMLKYKKGKYSVSTHKHLMINK